MRIAVYHSLPAGGARRVVNSAVPLLGRRHHVDLFTIDLAPVSRSDLGLNDPQSGVSRLVRAQLPLRALARISTPASPLHVPAITVRLGIAESSLAETIDAGGYDVCWVHHSLHIHAPFLLRHLATPTLYFVEEPRRRSFEALAGRSPHATVPAPLAGPAWALERFLRHADSKSTSRATAIAANSAFTAEAVLRAYGRSAWVCHLGVDHELFAPAARREDHLDHPPYVMAVGTLDWIKGHELALDAVALMGAPRPRVVIAYERSAPGYAGVLQRRAQRSGVELELRHGISDHQLCQLYRGAMVTLCLSRLEPFGLTALESLCTGTPVVALGEGGFRETVVDGRNGYVVEPEAQSVRDAIEAVRVGRLGADRSAIRRSVVPHFTLPAMVDRLEGLLERTVTLARSRQGRT